MVFHHVNAYEDEGHVVFDMIIYEESNIYEMFYIQNMTQETSQFVENNKSFSPPIVQRFVLPLNVQKVQNNHSALSWNRLIGYMSKVH